MRVYSFMLLLIVGLSACNDSSVSYKVTEAEIVPSVSLSDADRKIICRATVASTMGRELSIIDVDKYENETTYVSYARPSDGKIWKTRCKINGDKVIWSTVDQGGPGTGFGRWRNHSQDSIINFSLDDTSVTITETFADGSGSPEKFSRDDM